MRVWVMENGLVDETGHHFNNSVGLRLACERHGLQTRFLIHQNATPGMLQTLQGRAIFRFRPYAEVSRDPLAGPLESLFIQGKAFAEGFDTAVTEGLEPQDLVFVPTATQHEIYGCALGVGRLAPERRPRLVLTFRVDNFLAPGELALGRYASLYRFAIRQLGSVTRPERVLLTATSRMAEWLTRVLARPVAEYPMTKRYPFNTGSEIAPASSREPPCVAILGHSLPKKGFLLAPALVARNPQVRWTVQVAPGGADALWGEAREIMRTAENVELVVGSLDPGAYYDLIARSDIVLLPYDMAHRPLRDSGVFAEAVAAGKVVVVPQGSWMSDQLEAGHACGTVFDSHTPTSISHALHQALERLPELNSRARAIAPAWRREQSVFAWVDRLLHHFNMIAPTPRSDSEPMQPH